MAFPVVLSEAIELYRGDSRTIKFNFYSDDEQTVPVDLTAYGTVWTGNIRKKPDEVLLETLTIDASDAATGSFTVTLTPASWDELAGVKSMGWDVQVAAADGSSVTTLVAGRFQVTPDYTHV